MVGDVEGGGEAEDRREEGSSSRRRLFPSSARPSLRPQMANTADDSFAQFVDRSVPPTPSPSFPSSHRRFVSRIHYSERYAADDNYEYRHVILPKGLLKLGQSYLRRSDAFAFLVSARRDASGCMARLDSRVRV